MIRSALKNLEFWKESKDRKPMIVKGARQVGKTWLMKRFGKSEFGDSVAYINFENNTHIKKLFEDDFNIKRIVTSIEIETNQKIEPGKTLIIFDEIQEAPKGLTSLKYFYEQAPEYHVMAAGSLLGISLQKENTFPVGKVDFLELYPLSFLEFVENLGEERLAEELAKLNWPVLSVFHDKLIELLRLYYFIGGMPEAVHEYIQSKSLETVRAIQWKLLTGYEFDFGKHAPSGIVPKIRLVWNNLISQLAKENKRFVYGQVKKGARAQEFEGAIQWLTDAGLMIKVSRVEKPTQPLNAYADLDVFKLFFVDVGLLNAMAQVDVKVLLEKNNILTEFKGAMTEQFVCQQLNAKTPLYYWSAQNAQAEVDFLLQHENEVVPIEVKAEENTKSKSLRVFKEKFGAKKALRLSASPYRDQDWMVNIPLYGANAFLHL